MISNVISFLEKGKEKKEKNNKAEKVEKNTVRLLIRVGGKLVGSGRVGSHAEFRKKVRRRSSVKLG